MIDVLIAFSAALTVILFYLGLICLGERLFTKLYDGPRKVQIRFDGPPGPESGRFVEIEDENGRSIRFGEWEQDGSDWLLCFEVTS